MMNKKKKQAEDLLELVTDREVTVGQLAESITRATGIRCTPGMINNYEKLGLVQHASRTEGGMRRFKIKDIQVISQIKRWQAEGMSLAQIKNKLSIFADEMPAIEDFPYLPDDKRMRILEAAARIFPQKGYEATTIKEIAAEADISPSMVYQFYKSKEDLFLSFTENTAYSQIMEVMTESLTHKKDFNFEDIRQALFDVAYDFVTWHIERLELIRLLVATSRTFPGIGKQYREKLMRPTEQLLAQYFRRLSAYGQFTVSDPECASKVFFSIFADMALSWNWFSGESEPVFPGKHEILASIDTYLNGIFCNPTPNSSGVD